MTTLDPFAAVIDWYAANPNAVKNPSRADLSYWNGQRAILGDAAARAKFNAVVASLTGTTVYDAQIGGTNPAGQPAPTGTPAPAVTTSQLQRLVPLLLAGVVIFWLIRK